MKIVLQDGVWEGEKDKSSRFIGYILLMKNFGICKNKLRRDT